MVIIGNRELENAVRRILLEHLSDILIELKPESTYLLVLPSDIPEKDIADAFKRFPDKPRIFFLQAENVKLLEFQKTDGK